MRAVNNFNRNFVARVETANLMLDNVLASYQILKIKSPAGSREFDALIENKCHGSLSIGKVLQIAPACEHRIIVPTSFSTLNEKSLRHTSSFNFLKR